MCIPYTSVDCRRFVVVRCYQSVYVALADGQCVVVKFSKSRVCMDKVFNESVLILVNILIALFHIGGATTV